MDFCFAGLPFQVETGGDWLIPSEGYLNVEVSG